MRLGFKQNFPWHTEKNPAPTNFREKILLGVDRYVIEDDTTGIQTVSGKSWQAKYVGQIAGIKPKLHTMRADPHNRWKAGRKIEMVYRGAGYKILDHFNKGIPELEVCTGVQQIVIKWKIITSAKGSVRMPLFFIDGNLFTDFDKLAANDGFDSWQQFCHWFKGDFTGKIIHWTDLRY